MKVPLRVSTGSESDKIHIHRSYHVDNSIPTRWVISDMNLSPVEETKYIYAAIDGENKFYEDGRIYNSDGSVADNELIGRSFFFYVFRHASLNKLIEQNEIFSYDREYFYGLRVGHHSNLKRIAVIRDRLNVPDWVAFLIFIGLVDEENVRSLLIDVPASFEAYPLDWVTRVLGVNPDDINKFGIFDENNFNNFCEIINLERQHVSSALKIGSV